MRRPGTFALSLALVAAGTGAGAAAGCVTESLSVCINCNGFNVSRLSGTFTVVLTASRGVAAPCEVLHTRLDPTISWEGCLEPTGGTVDTLRGLIRLTFSDSTGLPGAIEFLNVEGGTDSARSSWRTTCGKTAAGPGPGPGCPVAEGTARWFRPPATP